VYGSNLYAADTRNNLVYVYHLPMTSGVPDAAFAATAPMGLAFDSNGTLYVTSQGTNQIQVFNPPFSTPAVTITSGVSGAFGITAAP
jgi:sugar lactone lactonase YvrE